MDVILKTVRDGLRAARDGARTTYMSHALTRHSPEGFEEAFDVADAIPGWFDQVSAAAFWAVIHEIRPRSVVEIGSFLGRSTVFIAETLRRAGLSDATFHAIDPHTGDRQHLQKLGLDTVPTLNLFRVFLSSSGNSEAVTVHVARSDEALAEITGELDFVFVDGWHAYDAVLADVRGYGARLSDHGVMCIDDVRNYQDIERAAKAGLTDTGLHGYGVVGGKLWAGRPTEPPVCLRPVLRLRLV